VMEVAFHHFLYPQKTDCTVSLEMFADLS